MPVVRNILIQSRVTAIVSGLLLTAAMLWLNESGIKGISQLIQRAESLVYDLRLNAALPDTPVPDEQIVIVTIDEKSLKELGHWPWSRDRIALMTSHILEQGAAVIGFDIMFAEPEENSAHQLIREIDKQPLDNPAFRKQLNSLVEQVDHDRQFADTLQQGDIVLGYTFRSDLPDSPGMLPEPLATIDRQQPLMITGMPAYTGNLPLLQQAAGHGGFVTTIPDHDGILRRSPFLLRYDNKVYGSLALEMARLFYLIDGISINTAKIGDSDAVESITLGSITIPTDGAGRVIVPYRGASPAFRYVSASDVVNNTIDDGVFENKIVLIGATALGLSDLVATPVQSVYPGVEVHASMIKGILDKHFPVEPSWARGANLITILLAGLLLSFVLPMLGPLLQMLLAAVMAVTLVGMNFWFWQDKGLVLQLAIPLLLVMVLSGVNMTYGFLREKRQRGHLKDMFGQYVPPPLVEQMLRRPDRFSTEGESRELSVLFADIRNFTTLSETLAPNDLKTLLNNFFTPMTRIIFENSGTIDKYVGDMIMAFWGAPLKDEQHARHAVNAALEMLAAVDQLRPQFLAQGLPEINIGIGINTGIMNVGDMGSEFRRAYTVIGDAVNLASRIEGLTKYYGAPIVIGEDTERQLDDIVCRKLDRVRVKGKSTGVEVYQPLCHTKEASEALQAELARHHQALEFYWQRRWDEANEIFRQLTSENPQIKIYDLYLQRISEMRQQGLAEDWDGVYERRTK